MGTHTHTHIPVWDLGTRENILELTSTLAPVDPAQAEEQLSLVVLWLHSALCHSRIGQKEGLIYYLKLKIKFFALKRNT